MDTRAIIDYAMNDDAKAMRDALYASIHDRVNAHIQAQKQEIAQSIFPEEVEEEYEEIDEATGNNEKRHLDSIIKMKEVKKSKHDMAPSIHDHMEDALEKGNHKKIDQLHKVFKHVSEEIEMFEEYNYLNEDIGKALRGWDNITHDKEAHYHAAKGSPMHKAIVHAQKHGGSIHHYDDREGGFYHHGLVAHHPDKNEYHVKLGGMEVGDDSHTVHTNLGSAMRHIHKHGVIHGDDHDEKRNELKTSRMSSREKATDDKLYKTDRSGKKGTITKSHSNQLKQSIMYNKGKHGPKTRLPEEVQDLYGNDKD
jgi:hypothetical protein